MAMKNLPTTQQYPFDEEQIKSRDMQKLADYLKRLIRQEKSIYEDIARIVNVNAKEFNGLGISDFVKTLLDDEDATAARETLGLRIGTDVQAYSAYIAVINVMNEFTASQKLKGTALLWRWKDTGSGGKEWGIRSAGGNLEIVENTGAEESPVWTVRKTYLSGLADGGADGGFVHNLKPIVNAAANKLDVFAKTTGAAPDGSNPITIAIPDGSGYTFRMRSGSYLGGTSQIVMADDTNYWSKGNVAGEIKTAWLYAIWDGAGIVWALAGYSGFNTVPTTTTATDDDYFLLEKGSTYTRNASHYCVAVAKIRYEYDTEDDPDHTIQASGENAPLIQWNPKSDYGRALPLTSPITAAFDIGEQSFLSAAVCQGGRYEIFSGFTAITTGNSDLHVALFLRTGPATFSSATNRTARRIGRPTSANTYLAAEASFQCYLNAGDFIHAGAYVVATEGTRQIIEATLCFKRVD